MNTLILNLFEPFSQDQYSFLKHNSDILDSHPPCNLTNACNQVKNT